jgi:hypothetical protein
VGEGAEEMKCYPLYLFVLGIAVFGGCKTTSKVHTSDKISGSIINYGLINSSESSRYYVPQAEAGYATNNPGMEIIKTADTFTLRLGLKFGIDWEIKGLPADSTIILTHNISHPPLKDYLGRRSLGSFEDLPTYANEDGIVTSTDGFCFCEKNLLVPGVWTYSVLYNHNVIVSKSFFIRDSTNK